MIGSEAERRLLDKEWIPFSPSYYQASLGQGDILQNAWIMDLIAMQAALQVLRALLVEDYLVT